MAASAQASALRSGRPGGAGWACISIRRSAANWYKSASVSGASTKRRANSMSPKSSISTKPLAKSSAITSGADSPIRRRCRSMRRKSSSRSGNPGGLSSKTAVRPSSVNRSSRRPEASPAIGPRLASPQPQRSTKSASAIARSAAASAGRPGTWTTARRPSPATESVTEMALSGASAPNRSGHSTSATALRNASSRPSSSTSSGCVRRYRSACQIGGSAG